MLTTIKHTISIFTGVFYQPSTLFKELREKPSWIAAFTIIVILTVISGTLFSPFKQHVILQSLTEQMDEARVKEMFVHADTFSIIVMLFTPVPIIIKLSMIGGILLCGDVLLTKKKEHFSLYLMVAVFSEFILLFKDFVNLLILWIKGIQNIHSIMDLYSIVGLDYFLSDKSRQMLLYTVLSNFNPFTFWHIFVLATGFAIVSQIKTWRALIVASSIWVLGITFQLMITSLSADIMRMSGK